MKKLLLLIVPVMLLVVSCNNKPATTETTGTPDSTAAAPVDNTGTEPTTAANDSSGTGTGDMPALVWEEISGKPVTEAEIVAKKGGQTVEVVKSDAKGNYTFSKLTKGTAYDYTVTKNGFAAQTQNAAYDGDNSLPGFALKK